MPETTDGPRLLAGLVLVPERGASIQTMIAYKNGNRRGVYFRIVLCLKKKKRPAIIVNVVMTSPSKAWKAVNPSPGKVAP